MLKVWKSLLSDFRVSLDTPTIFERQSSALKLGVPQFRNEPWPTRMQAPIYLFKCQYQLENLFKRYTFKSDLLTPEARKLSAINSFAEYQQELATPPEHGYIDSMVMTKARSIIKRILGPFDQEELYNNVRFGKRANTFVPYSKSYLDLKVSCLSGSKMQHTWFDSYLKTDKVLQDIVSRALAGEEMNPSKLPVRLNVHALSVVPVPKSFATDRTITPNSVLGAMHSYALGVMIEDRLKKEGLNIRRLQSIQQRLARSSSRTRKYVTADLRKASDSYILQLINRLVPRPWYHELKRGRIKHVDVDGTVIPLQSYMAMGIGFTFTLQTLIFYALLKAISELTETAGRISVYGDDLIYPRKMHKYVLSIFPKIGFVINTEKTFASSHFRESCGGDYYHGTDVRPFQPEQVGQDMGHGQYITFCYKLLNGFLRRWDKVEIPGTVHLLLREIAAIEGRVYVVPPLFPDTSGLKCEDPKFLPWFVPCTKPVWNKELQCWSFMYRLMKHKDRYVTTVYPYFWEALRSMNTTRVEWSPFDDPKDAHLLRWIKHPNRKKRKYYRSKVSRKRLCELIPVVTDKTSNGRPAATKATTHSWALGTVG
jgi:hypothetical protein